MWILRTTHFFFYTLKTVLYNFIEFSFEQDKIR